MEHKELNVINSTKGIKVPLEYRDKKGVEIKRGSIVTCFWHGCPLFDVVERLRRNGDIVVYANGEHAYLLPEGVKVIRLEDVPEKHREYIEERLAKVFRTNKGDIK